MKVKELTAQQLTLLAAGVAVVALIILFTDLGIKRSILRESMALREVINGRNTGSGSEAGSDPGVHDHRGDLHHGDPEPGLPSNLENAPGGGIKPAAVLYGTAGR